MRVKSNESGDVFYQGAHGLRLRKLVQADFHSSSRSYSYRRSSCNRQGDDGDDASYEDECHKCMWPPVADWRL